MTAYLVLVQKRTTDADALATYRRHAPASAAGHQLTPLASYGALMTLEGEPVEGMVILAFPDVAQARAWYESPAYQKALAFRKAGAECDVFIVEGLT